MTLPVRGTGGSAGFFLADVDATAVTDDATERSAAVATMPLGTYHMATPGRDVVNVEADDVLAPERQAELATLADALADWGPDRVAVEAPHDWQADLDALYDDYRTGERAYDADGTFPDPLPDSFARNEAVQVGFRLADRLDHDRVLAVDHPPRVPEPTTEAAVREAMSNPPAPGDVDYPVPDTDEMADGDRLRGSTVREYLRWLNREPRLRESHALMFAAALEADDDEAAVGMLSSWYERNVRTVRTLWRRLEDADRVLLLYGSGHVRALRHLLTETPAFEPVSPLTVL